MSDTTQSAAGEPIQSQTGSGTDPSGAGTTAGLVPQSQLDQAEARRRATQSALDQSRNQLASVQGEVAQIKEMLGAFDPRTIATQIQATLTQQAAIRDAATALRQEFPNARADVFDASYSSPEEIAAAVKQSHEAETQYRDSVRADLERDVFARVKEAHGIDLTPAPQTPPGTAGEATGKLTKEQIASMPFSEFVALDPAVVAEALRQ